MKRGSNASNQQPIGGTKAIRGINQRNYRAIKAVVDLLDSPRSVDGETVTGRPVPRLPDDATEPVVDLLTAAAHGDAVAWGRLVRRFSGVIWSTARSHHLNPSDAADVSQTVWLRLVEHFAEIREPERLAGWLATVTRYECLRMLQASNREFATDHDFHLSLNSAEEEVIQRQEGDDRAAALGRALESLPRRDRALLRLLMAPQSHSYQDIAAALAMPIGSIGPTRRRCLQRLRISPEFQSLSRTA